MGTTTEPLIKDRVMHVARVLFADEGRSLTLHPAIGEDPDAFFEFVCARFENNNIEQDQEGNVTIMPPTGGESSDQNAEIIAQLRNWAKIGLNRGKCFDSNGLFILPDGSKKGPDASWVSIARLETLSKKDRRKFLRVVPEFVIELRSPTDRLPVLERKMERWIRNGVELGWLINPLAKSVLVYRRPGTGDELELIREPSFLSGEGPVTGFELDLRPVWEGLDF
jgi:Uma2 family endonuclease